MAELQDQVAEGATVRQAEGKTEESEPKQEEETEPGE